MAIYARKGSLGIVPALVASLNATRAALALAATRPHTDVTSNGTTGSYDAPTAGAAATVTAANASDLATSLVLANEIKLRYAGHGVDALAHKAADGTNLITSPNATDLATAITLANEIKTDYEAHRVSTTFHHVADSTNAIAATNASDQSSLNTLLNELKSDFNAHIQAALAGSSVVIIDA